MPSANPRRPLHRYARRWKLERLFAWLQNFRRIEVHHDRFLENYLAFVLRSCMNILLRSRFEMTSRNVRPRTTNKHDLR